MKRLVLLLGLFCLMSVYGLSQNYYDDLYYIPDSDDEISENIESDDSQTVETEDSRDAVTETGADVDYDSSGMAVDVDAYNRRYDADDTRTVAAAAETGSGTDVKKSAGEYSYADRNEDEGWVDGFSGSVDDYEYALRIIRFHSPRFAVHISSPYYWDIVYGLNSFDWNVYVDGSYAWAFPTFANPLWWDWRFSRPYWGFGAYPYGYYAGYWGIYDPFYYSPYYYRPHYYGWYGGPWWGHGPHHHRPHWSSPVYYDNRRPVSGLASGGGRTTGTYRRTNSDATRVNSGDTRRTSGTRVNASSDATRRLDTSTRTNASGVRSTVRRSSADANDRSGYTRLEGDNVRRSGSAYGGVRTGTSSVRNGSSPARDFSTTTRRSSSTNRSSATRSSFNSNRSSFNSNRSSTSFNRSSVGSSRSSGVSTRTTSSGRSGGGRR